MRFEMAEVIASSLHFDLCWQLSRSLNSGTWHIGVTQEHGIYLNVRGIQGFPGPSEGYPYTPTKRPPAKTYFKFNGLTNIPERREDWGGSIWTPLWSCEL